ncbi:MAG: rod-binding protein [Thermodesulfobacteriota bacterium]|nr:rod-binding protein [Thermodesulfobacteriota bacterium]
MSDTVSLPTLPWQTMDLTSRMRSLQDSMRPERLLSSGKGFPQLKKACSELESLFINYLFKEMRAAVPRSGFLSGGKSEEMFISMLDLQLSRELSSGRGIGLSKILLDQLDSGQEKTDKSPNELND